MGVTERQSSRLLQGKKDGPGVVYEIMVAWETVFFFRDVGRGKPYYSSPKTTNNHSDMTRTPITSTQGWLLGFIIGISAGIAIGVAMGRLAVGIAIGAGMGTALGAAFSSAAKEKGREASPGERRLLWWLLVAGLVLFALVVIAFFFL